MHDVYEELAITVAKGNPGALHIATEIVEFSSRGYGILLWCKDNLSGESLWIKYKDEFNQDIVKLRRWIEKQMEKDV